MERAKFHKIAGKMSGGWDFSPAGLLRDIEGLLFKTPAPAPAFFDNGYVMSAQDGSDAVRFFYDLNCDLKRIPVGAVRGLINRKVGDFERLAALLNGKYGYRLDLRFVAAAAALIRENPGLGWPFFGAKIRSNGGMILNLYLIETSWRKNLGWRNIERLTSLFGVDAGRLERSGLRGVYDCMGISFSSSGRKLLKLYTRFPVPAGGSIRPFVKLHGPDSADFFKENMRLGAVYPFRHWTNEYRFKPPPRILRRWRSRFRGPDSVKTEIHFLKPVPADKIGNEFFKNRVSRFLAGRNALMAANGCAVTALAMEKRKVTIYFR